MVRTVVSTIKTTGGKKTAGKISTSSTTHSSSRSIGGNKLVQRPIPEWQKPIGSFFKKPEVMGNTNTNLADEYNWEGLSHPKTFEIVKNTVTNATSSTAVSSSDDGVMEVEPPEPFEWTEAMETDKENQQPMSVANDEINVGASTSESARTTPIAKRKWIPPLNAVPKRRKTECNFQCLENFEKEFSDRKGA